MFYSGNVLKHAYLDASFSLPRVCPQLNWLVENTNQFVVAFAILKFEFYPLSSKYVLLNINTAHHLVISNKRY